MPKTLMPRRAVRQGDFLFHARRADRRRGWSHVITNSLLVVWGLGRRSERDQEMRITQCRMGAGMGSATPERPLENVGSGWLGIDHRGVGRLASSSCFVSCVPRRSLESGLTCRAGRRGPVKGIRALQGHWGDGSTQG